MGDVMVGEAERRCLKCREVKALGEFKRHKRYPAGRFYYCRECAAGVMRRVREDPGYRKREAEQRRMERVKMAEWRERFGKAWRRMYPGESKRQLERRRERLKMNGGTFTDEQFEAVCEAAQWRCLACGREGKWRGIGHNSGVELQADHVIPVSLGGVSDIRNIQCLCGSCNAKKGVSVRDFRASGVSEEYREWAESGDAEIGRGNVGNTKKEDGEMKENDVDMEEEGDEGEEEREDAEKGEDQADRGDQADREDGEGEKIATENAESAKKEEMIVKARRERDRLRGVVERFRESREWWEMVVNDARMKELLEHYDINDADRLADGVMEADGAKGLVKLQAELVARRAIVREIRERATGNLCAEAQETLEQFEEKNALFLQGEEGKKVEGTGDAETERRGDGEGGDDLTTDGTEGTDERSYEVRLADLRGKLEGADEEGVMVVMAAARNMIAEWEQAVHDRMVELGLAPICGKIGANFYVSLSAVSARAIVKAKAADPSGGLRELLDDIDAANWIWEEMVKIETEVMVNGAGEERGDAEGGDADTGDGEAEGDQTDQGDRSDRGNGGGRRYWSIAGGERRKIFVTDGISDGKTWFTAYRAGAFNSLKRLKSKDLPSEDTREKAQLDLDAYALDHGLEEVVEEEVGRE